MSYSFLQMSAEKEYPDHGTFPWLPGHGAVPMIMNVGRLPAPGQVRQKINVSTKYFIYQ